MERIEHREKGCSVGHTYTPDVIFGEIMSVGFCMSTRPCDGELKEFS